MDANNLINQGYSNEMSMNKQYINTGSNNHHYKSSLSYNNEQHVHEAANCWNTYSSPCDNQYGVGSNYVHNFPEEKFYNNFNASPNLGHNVSFSTHQVEQSSSNQWHMPGANNHHILPDSQQQSLISQQKYASVYNNFPSTEHHDNFSGPNVHCPNPPVSSSSGHQNLPVMDYKYYSTNNNHQTIYPKKQQFNQPYINENFTPVMDIQHGHSKCSAPVGTDFFEDHRKQSSFPGNEIPVCKIKTEPSVSDDDIEQLYEISPEFDVDEYFSSKFKKLDRDFCCLLCNYKTIKKSHAKYHSLTHSKRKLFRCPKYCGYEANSRNNIKLHLQKHCQYINKVPNLKSRNKGKNSKKITFSEKKTSKIISNKETNNSKIFPNDETSNSTKISLNEESNNSKISLNEETNNSKIIFNEDTSNSKISINEEKNTSKIIFDEETNKDKIIFDEETNSSKITFNEEINNSKISFNKETNCSKKTLHNKKNKSKKIMNKEKSPSRCKNTQQMYKITPEFDSNKFFMSKCKKSDDSFKCLECSYTTMDKRHAKQHVLVHSDKKLFKCMGDCDFETNRGSVLQTHIQNHFNDAKHDLRPQNLDNKNLTNHKEVTPPSSIDLDIDIVPEFDVDVLFASVCENVGKNFRCLQCDYKTPNKRHAKKHVLTHSERKLFKCLKNCGFETNERRTLQNHMQNHLKDAKHHLKIGLENRNSDKEIANIDSEMFDIIPEFDIDAHFLLTCKNIGKNFQCLQCNYHTIVRRHAREHSLTHSAEKLFKCQKNCGFSTNRKTVLKKHIIRTHMPDLNITQESSDLVKINKNADRGIYLNLDNLQTFEDNLPAMDIKSDNEDSSINVNPLAIEYLDENKLKDSLKQNQAIQIKSEKTYKHNTNGSAKVERVRFRKREAALCRRIQASKYPVVLVQRMKNSIVKRLFESIMRIDRLNGHYIPNRDTIDLSIINLKWSHLVT